MPATVLRSATMVLQYCCFHTRTPVGRGCFSMCFLRIMCQLKRLSLDCVSFQSPENCHQKKPDHPKCQPVFASQPTWLLQYCCFHTRTPCYLSCPPAGPWGKLASTSCARTFNSFGYDRQCVGVWRVRHVSPVLPDRLLPEENICHLHFLNLSELGICQEVARYDCWFPCLFLAFC